MVVGGRADFSLAGSLPLRDRGLYVFAESVGAISRTYPSLNDWTTPNNGAAINEWPYPDGGLWGALTNVAVVVLVVLLTTVATSWWMRHSYERSRRVGSRWFFC